MLRTFRDLVLILMCFYGDVFFGNSNLRGLRGTDWFLLHSVSSAQGAGCLFFPHPISGQLSNQLDDFSSSLMWLLSAQTHELPLTAMLLMFLCYLLWGLLGVGGDQAFFCMQLPKCGVVALRLAVTLPQLLGFLLWARQYQGLVFSQLQHKH